MHSDKDLEDLTSEIVGVSAITLGLSIQFDDTIVTLSREHMQNALCGISSYLKRISEDLKEIRTI